MREQVATLGNGFELWRRYAVDFMGREKELKSEGKIEFRTFPTAEREQWPVRAP